MNLIWGITGCLKWLLSPFARKVARVSVVVVIIVVVPAAKIATREVEVMVMAIQGGLMVRFVVGRPSIVVNVLATGMLL